MTLTVCNACTHVVEFVRSSFRSTWVIDPLKPQRLKGRYVFVPKGTPDYPFAHYFGSRHWLTEEEQKINGLGDQGPDFGCSSPWDNGEGLPDIPRDILVNEDCPRDRPKKPTLPRICDGRFPVPETVTVTFSFGKWSVDALAVLVSEFGFWQIQGLPLTVVDANGGAGDGLIVINAGPDLISLDCDLNMSATLSIQVPFSFEVPGDYSSELKFLRPLLWVIPLSKGTGVVQTPGGPVRDTLRIAVAGNQFE